MVCMRDIEVLVSIKSIMHVLPSSRQDDHVKLEVYELIVTVICLAHVRLLENLYRVDPATMFVDCHVYNMHVDVWHRVRDLCATLITFGCDQSDVTPPIFCRGE